MDINKVSGEEQLRICSIYFKGGFACLPFMWLVNFIWFFRLAFLRPAFPQQAQIRRYVIFSAVGCLVWIGALVAWNVVFQTKRASWGATGDNLSMVYPRGRA